MLRPIALLLLTLLMTSAIGCRQHEPSEESKVPESLANAEANDPEPGAPGSPTNKLKSDVNPNGDSELAVLMREMHQTAKETRKTVLAGSNLPPLPEDQTRILSAWPTDPDVRGPEFDALARDYLGQLEALHAAKGDPAGPFDQLVDACVGCHQSFCPGPIPTIEKLHIASTDTSSDPHEEL